MNMQVGRPLRGEAAERIRDRVMDRVQRRPKRCIAQLFEGPEWRCHRDVGHSDAHVHYNEINEGLSAWANGESA